MSDITILTEHELRECVALDREAIDVVQQAFAELAGGHVVMPPILSMSIEDQNGEVDVKTAYVPGLEGFAIKVSPGFFDNPKLGLPSLNGLMILFSSQTGVVQAVLLDNGYLTEIRTAAAGAVAADHLAKRDIRTAGVIGAGSQADLQMRALKLVRDFEELLVWARDRDKALAYAERMSDLLGCSIRAVTSAEDCVRNADIVVTTTPSREALIRADWLHPGLHITAMGSDSDEKNELDPNVLLSADRFVCDRRTQSVTLGEMRSAIAAGVMGEDAEVDELGELCAQSKPGRESDEQVTVCDLTGTGVQDTAIATHAYRHAVANELGTIIRS